MIEPINSTLPLKKASWLKTSALKIWAYINFKILLNLEMMDFRIRCFIMIPQKDMWIWLMFKGERTGRKLTSTKCTNMNTTRPNNVTTPVLLTTLKFFKRKTEGCKWMIYKSGQAIPFYAETFQTKCICQEGSTLTCSSKSSSE